MALVYSRKLLSGSTNGRPIKVDAVASLGTTIHTVGASATDGIDEVHLFVANRDTTAMPLTIEHGGTATTDLIKSVIPALAGYFRIDPGISLSATTSIIRAFTTGTATDSLVISGWVNRAT